VLWKLRPTTLTSPTQKRAIDIAYSHGFGLPIAKANVASSPKIVLVGISLNRIHTRARDIAKAPRKCIRCEVMNEALAGSCSNCGMAIMLEASMKKDGETKRIQGAENAKVS
jgi:hypothetical protein